MQDKTDIVLEAKGIYKEYDGETIIADACVQAHAGEIVALRGESGAGKSTFLSILGLLLSPSAGTVNICGHVCENLSDASLSKIRSNCIGFVFQHTQLIATLRAWENVNLPSLLAGEGSREQRARELLVGYGLQDRLEHFPHQLSVGQKRRVALARAQLLQPAVLLADEPTNDLDRTNANKVIEFLQKAAQSGQGVLIATHDDALAACADRTITLQGGRIE